MVLLAVRLGEDHFDENEFKDWMCSVPAPAKSIKVLGAIPSLSTLLLIQVPVVVWDLLPPSPAVSFIGFVDLSTGYNISAGSTYTAEADVDPPITESEGEDRRQRALDDEPEGSVFPTDQVEALPSSGASFNFKPSTRDEKSIVFLLDRIDATLPTIFRTHGTEPATVHDADKRIIQVVLDVLIEEAKTPSSNTSYETIVKYEVSRCFLVAPINIDVTEVTT